MYKDILNFRFGTDILPTTKYSEKKGFGFLPYKNISIVSSKQFLSCTNFRSNGNIPLYEYPTFVVDVPNGIYELTFKFCSNGNEDAVNGAYVNENMYSVRWSNDSFATSFVEPLSTSYIVTKAGETRIETVRAAVYNKKIEIKFATSITDEGLSGNVCIESLDIKSLGFPCQKSVLPTLRFIGDSTLAKYPPEDGNVWTPIPERTGWGEDFSMKRFTDNTVILVNKAVAGSSLKSYIYEGFLNDYLLTCNPGDTVIIESGINDTAAGRRFSDKEDFEFKLQQVINACTAFNQTVILSSGTSSSYIDSIKALAVKNKLNYIPLKETWEEYQHKLNITQAQMTVDGTHLRRVGAIVAAWIVANNISKFEELPISTHFIKEDINYTTPSVKVDSLHIKRQTKSSLTLAWDLSNEQVYDNEQLIIGFNIFEQMGAGKSKFIQFNSAYVSAGMSNPFLQSTIETDLDINSSYYITAVGLTGEGPSSNLVKVTPFVPSEEAIMEQHVIESKIKSNNDFILSLNSGFKPLLNNDFSLEKTSCIPWQLSGNHSGLASVVLEENGNKYLRLYVEAAGPRYVTKIFNESKDLNADEMLIDFDWYPGCPDDRNVTELEFLTDDNNRLISFKTSSNGHIGYVTGNYDLTDVSYMAGNGFHPYAASNAVDLELANNQWYNIKLHIKFKTQVADLYIFSIESNTWVRKINNIKLCSNGHNTISSLNFLLLRGKQDNRVTNGLSILWETKINSFAMYYCI